jgi:hypothetical protein
MGQKRKSLMQFSRSSSERFNKLQKLEKKNIADDCLMESAEMTINRNFQSN